jgi:chromosome segregation and condensation protein ScpB
LFTWATGLSIAALEVLSNIAYRQPTSRFGIELIRCAVSDSALDYQR